MQAQDNVLFSGKIEEYEAAFNLVDTDKKGQGLPLYTMQSGCLSCIISSPMVGMTSFASAPN